MASVLGHNMHCVVLFAQHKDVTKVKASKEQKNLQDVSSKSLTSGLSTQLQVPRSFMMY